MALCVYTHSKVAIGTAALGDGFANVVHEVLLAAGRGADSLLLKLDLRHGVRSRAAQWAQCRGGIVRSAWRLRWERVGGRAAERGWMRCRSRHLEQHWALRGCRSRASVEHVRARSGRLGPPTISGNALHDSRTKRCASGRIIIVVVACRCIYAQRLIHQLSSAVLAMAVDRTALAFLPRCALSAGEIR